MRPVPGEPNATGGTISVFLADDNLIIREGVKALVQRQPDLEVVGVAADYDELVAGAEAANPQVVVSDIRMPPTFQREGIEAAKEVRKRHPGTGVVILSQYDDPEYAIALLSEGAAGYGYLLKDRLAEGDQLVQAIRYAHHPGPEHPAPSQHSGDQVDVGGVGDAEDLGVGIDAGHDLVG